MERGQYTYQEILSQPAAWEAALSGLAEAAPALRTLDVTGFDQVLFTGCGSTYYLALAAAALFSEVTGRPARGLPASELWLYPRLAYPAQGKTLLVAVSRSGETTETLHAGRAFLAAGRGPLVTLSCYPGCSLSQLGQFNLVLPSGQEQSVAQTRAFSTLYLGTVALTLLWAGDSVHYAELARLPAAGQALLERYTAHAETLGRDPRFTRFYFLGSGPRYGLAAELSLKMKEMSLSHSEPFHFLEFRHGPKSMVNAETLVIGLLSEHNGAPERQVLDEMRALGATILALGESDADVAFNSHVAEVARNILYLPIGQRLAFEHALAQGLDPDRPHNLDAVVKLG